METTKLQVSGGQFNTSNILNSALTLIENLSHKLMEIDVQLPEVPPESKRFYRLLPCEKQIQVLNNLKHFSASIDASLSQIQTRHIGKAEEVACLKFALEQFNMELPSDENFDFIERGVGIEIYSPDSIQLYRNFEFIKKCPYDLLTLLSREWYELFERDDYTNKIIAQELQSVIRSENMSSMDSQIPEHSLRCLLSKHYEIHFIKFKKVKPVVSKLTGAKIGLILTSIATHSKLTEIKCERTVTYLKKCR